MFRFLFRLAAMVALSICVILAVLDTTRTVAASALVMTPLRASWLATSPETLAGFEALVREKAGSALWDAAIAPVVDLPGFAVFGGLAALLYAIGYRRRRHGGHLATTQ